MSWFRRRRAAEERVASLEADVVDLRNLAETLRMRLTRLETRPLPRPSAVTLHDLARLEGLAHDAVRSASIARADVAVRISTVDGMVAHLTELLNNEHEAVRARIDALTTTLEHQSEYLEAHAERVAVRVQATGGLEPEQAASLRANQIRIANELARLSIELREELARLASIVKPGEVPLSQSGPTPANGSTLYECTTDSAVNSGATAPITTVDLRS